MQYFVVAPDGMKYGPADSETLKQWVAENRLDRNTLLEEADTRQRLRAESLAGLFPQPEPEPVAAPEPPLVFENASVPPVADYPRVTSADSGGRELTKAWIWTLVGVLIPLILPSIGLSYANKAIAMGNEEAHGARIFAITVLVAQIVVILVVGAIVGFFAFAISATS